MSADNFQLFGQRILRLLFTLPLFLNSSIADAKTTQTLAFMDSEVCRAAVNWPERIVGEARNIRTGKLRYTEHYHYAAESDMSYVDYRSEVGAVFMQKIIDGRESAVAPNYYAVDTRLQRLNSYFVDDQTVYWGAIEASTFCQNRDSEQLQQQLFFRPARTGLEGQAERFIVDAGFDAYIARNWSALYSGDQQGIDFATSDKRGKVTLVIKRVDSKLCGEKIAAVPDGQLDDKPARDTVCFKLSPKNWLVNRLIKPIYLGYGDEDRRLYYFYGLTNIPTSEGKRQRLLISYRYND